MKKILLTLIISFVSLVSWAAPPNLNVLKLFDGRYIGNPNVDLTLIDDNDEIYRSISVTEDNEVASVIEKAFYNDKSGAISSVFNQKGNMTNNILSFSNNGHEYTVCLSKNGGTIRLFISGPQAAFK